MELDWKPIKNNKSYCAPACGFDCQHKDFINATKKAKALCDKLGQGFQPEVWENLGWHWAVKRGHITVMQDRNKEFSATYDNEIWLYGKTAYEALKQLLRHYREKSRNVAKIATEISWAIPGNK